jgi:ATP-dependent RNA helicase RhlE
MNQNNNRGNAPRHPRSPLPKSSGAPSNFSKQTNNQSSPRPPKQSHAQTPPSAQQRRSNASAPSALFTSPPKQARNWLDDTSANANASITANRNSQLQPVKPDSIGASRRNSNLPRNIENDRIAQSNRANTNGADKKFRNDSNVSHPTGDDQFQHAKKVSAPHVPKSHSTTSPPREPATEDHGFAALGLREELVRAVLAHGYSTPTPIQKQGIPAVLDGGDLLGGAQTGTGKTAGFVLPMLQRLNAKPASKRGNSILPRALILAPTRELAAQVEESVRVYGKFLPLTSTVIFGGVNINPQITTMCRGVDVVVATPGRLLDLHQQRAIDLSAIEILVLDEADRMLDMGFIHDIKKVLAVLPPKRQNLLFSATFSDDIKALADRLLNNPRMIEVARRNTTVEVVDQSVVLVDKANKAKLLIHLVKERQWFQVLVFTRTKHGANRLAEQLSKSGIPAMAIHGNKSQSARMKALAEFKSNTLQVLVATDIAARGIDIDQLPHVVNYELPNVPEDYVHRIGRTGRAGATGEAMSLVMKDELPLLKDIEKFTKQSIPKITIDGFNPAAIPEPSAPSSDARDAEFQRNGGRPPSRGRPRSSSSGARASSGGNRR